MDMEFFANCKYKILSCMHQRQVDVAGENIVQLSQRQIAEITGIAYKTVNISMKALRDNGYVIRQGTTRGRYFLTNKALTALATIQKGDVQK
jgi:biotin operon repressor